MQRYVTIGRSILTGVIAAVAAVSLSAQAPAPGGASQTAKPQPTQGAKPAQPQGAKPAQEGQGAKPAQEGQKPAQTTQKPAAQTAKAGTGEAGGAVNLGTVRIPRAVKAGGESLAAGTYTVRVTEQPATPPAPGQTPQFERWAEFMRNGKVVAREVVTVVPAGDIKQIAEMNPPPAGGSRTEVLKGGDYLRVWINRGGNHYLIHFNL